MLLEQIEAAWTGSQTNDTAMTAWWDGRAASFAENSRQLPRRENSLTVRLLEDAGMIKPGGTALDVGCGAGRYSFLLADRGMKVHGTDISPEMIRYARQRAEEEGSTVTFSADNWRQVELVQWGWERAFDLVLANTTPAICSVETFRKLSRASRNWCLLTKPTRRTNSVLDPLRQLIGVDTDLARPDEELAYGFSLLWLEGYCPRLDYEVQHWNHVLPLEEAISFYTRRMATFGQLDGEKERQIAGYLGSIARDGMVEEETDTTITALYWQVK